MKGGYLGVVTKFPSEMAQNFWLAIFAFGACFLVTVFLSLATRRTKTDEQLKGLVYSLTPKIVDDEHPLVSAPGNRRHGADHCVHHFEHHFLVN